MIRTIFACLILQALLSTIVSAEEKFNSYLHSESEISRMSKGKIQKRSTFLWATAISPLGLGKDERKAASLYGFLMAQTRFLNIDFGGGGKRNLVVFNDAASRDSFLKKQFSNIPPSEMALGITSLPECGTLVATDDAGRIELAIATNFHEYGTADFSACLQMIGFRAFGVHLKNDHFAQNPNDKASDAYKFLTEIYRTADRQNPFASISPR